MKEKGYFWSEPHPLGDVYGAKRLEDGSVRCDFPGLGTYWDVRFILSPSGAKAAIFPKGRATAVYASPISKEYANYVMRAEDNKVSGYALEIVCGWLKKFTDDILMWEENV